MNKVLDYQHHTTINDLLPLDVAGDKMSPTVFSVVNPPYSIGNKVTTESKANKHKNDFWYTPFSVRKVADFHGLRNV